MWLVIRPRFENYKAACCRSQIIILEKFKATRLKAGTYVLSGLVQLLCVKGCQELPDSGHMREMSSSSSLLFFFNLILSYPARFPLLCFCRFYRNAVDLNFGFFKLIVCCHFVFVRIPVCSLPWIICEQIFKYVGIRISASAFFSKEYFHSEALVQGLNLSLSLSFCFLLCAKNTTAANTHSAKWKRNQHARADRQTDKVKRKTPTWVSLVAIIVTSIMEEIIWAGG